MKVLLLTGLVLSLAGSLSVAAQGKLAYPPKIEGAAEHVYKEVDGAELKLWAFRPEGWKASDTRPGIVFFFGGGWKSGSPMQFVPQCQVLAKRGMVAMVADYRVASRHGVKAKDCVADARDAMRFVRKKAATMGVDPKRLAAGGGSAGGHIAACLGVIGDDTESRPDAMVLFNPACVLAPLDGENFFGRNRGAAMAERMGVAPEALSPAHHVDAKAPPCVIFHGQADTTVPYATAVAFADRMKAAGVTCVLHGYEGEGHGFFNAARQSEAGKASAYSQTMEQLDAFLVKLGWLKKQGS